MGKIYLLSNQKYDGVQNLEVFKINFIPSLIDYKKYDALIITSKNAILAIDEFSSKWKDIPCYAIALKTAKVIEKLGGKVEFIGLSGHGNEFANELIPHLKNKRVLYLRAKRVVSNLVEILKNENIYIKEEIVYETICNENINKNLEKNSTFIFTSPSTIECFFKNFIWDKSYNAIVIGNTTALYLPKNIKYKVSSQTSIEECIKLARLPIL